MAWPISPTMAWKRFFMISSSTLSTGMNIGLRNQVPVGIDFDVPTRRDECRGVVLLDDGGTSEHSPGTEHRPIVDRDLKFGAVVANWALPRPRYLTVSRGDPRELGSAHVANNRAANVDDLG